MGFDKVLGCLVLLMVALLLLPLLAWGQTRSGQQIEVRVLPIAEVFGETFTLGEIAEMDGFDIQALEELAKIEVGRSPLPGRELWLSESMLRSRLAGWKGLPLKLIIPKGATVMREGLVVAGGEIAKMLLEHARREIELAEGAELKQEITTPVRDAILPKGLLSWEILPVGTHLVEGGSRVYRVTAMVNGDKAWEAVVRVRQKIFRRVAVAQRPIRRGQTIGKRDLALQRTNVSFNRGDAYITFLDDAVGKQAKRHIGKGEAIRVSVVAAPADIAEGGRVTVIFETRAFVVRAPGVALVKGKVGQFIPVRNLESGKIVYGILGADESVRVN